VRKEHDVTTARYPETQIIFCNDSHHNPRKSRAKSGLDLAAHPSQMCDRWETGRLTIEFSRMSHSSYQSECGDQSPHSRHSVVLDPELDQQKSLAPIRKQLHDCSQ
jgi:hypothetical protein